MAKLIISLDGVTVREVVLDRDHISLGRRPYNHIVLDNLAVSGDHAVFQYVDGAFYVEDVNSTNGTSVNGVKIKRQQLWHGDVIGVARFRLRFDFPAGEEMAPLKVTGVLNSAIRVLIAEDPAQEAAELEANDDGVIMQSEPDVVPAKSDE